jgi:hypothetical protein
MRSRSENAEAIRRFEPFKSKVMQSLIDSVNSIKNLALARQLSVANKLGIPEDDPPAGVFAMCYNHVIQAFELLDFYARIWSQVIVANAGEIERSRQENAQRVIMATQNMFIHCMSSIEFGAKQALALHPGLIPLTGSRIYLRRIIESSNERGFVADEDKSLWLGAVEVRNCLIHNNGIADCNANYSFPELDVQMVDGRVIRGTLHFFPRLTHWAIDAFSRWALVAFGPAA